MTNQHTSYMQLALAQAQQAAKQDEVPVGAVLVVDGKVIAQAHNRTKQTNNPCAHAEIIVLQQAAQMLENHRLNQAILYLTLEPCAMCAGAIFHARVKQVIYAVADPKTGTAGSVVNLFANSQLNHQTTIHLTSSLGEQYQDWSNQCQQLIQDFFANKRKLAKQQQINLAIPEQALRTDWQRFAQLASSDYGCFTNKLPALQGLRMHYFDSQSSKALSSAKLCIVALHPRPLWSHCFIDMWQQWKRRDAQIRLLAPDLIGFGASDKWKKQSAYSLEQQLTVLQQWRESLQLTEQLLLLGVEDDLLFTQLCQLLKVKNDQQIKLPKTWASNMQAIFKQQNLFELPFEDTGYYAGVKAWHKIAPNNIIKIKPTDVQISEQQLYNRQFADKIYQIFVNSLN